MFKAGSFIQDAICPTLKLSFLFPDTLKNTLARSSFPAVRKFYIHHPYFGIQCHAAVDRTHLFFELAALHVHKVFSSVELRCVALHLDP